MSESEGEPDATGVAAARPPAMAVWQRYAALVLGLTLFAYVFIQNAWVSDDAYITFRSLEQLFAGNGPVWNPHQRVQVYTHPLWYWVQVVFRLFSANVFLNVILASFLACFAAMLLMARSLSITRWLALLLLLISSKSYIDYTSSGLENPLSGLLLVLFFLVLGRIGEVRLDARAAAGGRVDLPRVSMLLLLIFSLLLLSRPDLATLAFPAMGWALWKLRGQGVARVSKLVLLGLAPLILFGLFSLFYYGFPFPNTAYAKLSTGIRRGLLLTQGVHYVESLRLFDPVLPLVAVTAFVRGVVSSRPVLRALAWGLPLNLAYVIWIGGDFMAGRFFAAAYLVSALLLVAVPWRRASALVLLVAVAGIGLWSPFSPLRSTPSYDYREHHGQVADERGVYFRHTSLHAWWKRDRKSVFPNMFFSRAGLRASKARRAVVMYPNVGMFGYWAGTDKIIVDKLALTDPLLARLPVPGFWRIGHFERRVPAGYVESLRTGENHIEDPSLHRLYEDLRLITQGDLLRGERFAAILRMNLGLGRSASREDQQSEPENGSG